MSPLTLLELTFCCDMVAEPEVLITFLLQKIDTSFKDEMGLQI